jgi:glycosyltransferase involved in cell wall biosynthesis
VGGVPLSDDCPQRSEAAGLRVLFINTVYSGGGAERSARELMEGVAAAGAETTMLVSARRGNEPPAVRGVRWAHERVFRPVERRLRRPLDWAHLGSRLALRRVTRASFDVVHLHNLHGGWISLRAVADLARRVPCVWTLHDEWAPTGGLAYDLSALGGEYVERARRSPGNELLFGETALAARYRHFIHGSLPRPEVVISPSAYLMDLAARSGRFPGARLVNLPYGLTMQHMPEASVSQREARQRFAGIGPDDRVVLLMAAHFKSLFKGLPAAVDALRTLPADAFKVLLVGGAGEGVAQQIRQRVVQTGYLKDDRAVASAFRAADLTLVPSIADNFPYVALESLACERPLVTFQVGGLTEIVGRDERGLGVTPFDTAQLGRRVMTLLDGPELRARLGEAGRRWVVERCDTGRWVAAHLEVYRDATERFNIRQTAGDSGVAVAPAAGM